MHRENKDKRPVPVNKALVLLVTVTSFWLFASVVTNFLERCLAVLEAVAPEAAMVAPPDVLPRGARTAIDMLHAVRAHNYRISAGVAVDGALMQRLVEGAYPLLVAEDARYLVRLERETSPIGCSVVLEQKGIALDICR